MKLFSYSLTSKSIERKRANFASYIIFIIFVLIWMYHSMIYQISAFWLGFFIILRILLPSHCWLANIKRTHHHSRISKLGNLFNSMLLICVETNGFCQKAATDIPSTIKFSQIRSHTSFPGSSIVKTSIPLAEQEYLFNKLTWLCATSKHAAVWWLSLGTTKCRPSNVRFVS